MPGKKRARREQASDASRTWEDSAVVDSEGTSESPARAGSPPAAAESEPESLRGDVLRGASFVCEYARGGPAEPLMRRLPTMIRSTDAALIPPGSLEHDGVSEDGMADVTSTSSKYLVVFDMDETIVYARKGPLVLRPHAAELLRMCGERCELALWTAGSRAYAKAILHEINKRVWGRSPAGVVKHLITRDCVWFDGEDYTKDLLKLGRSLDKVLIVENAPDCVRLNPQNAIIVEDFRGPSEGEPTLKVLLQVISEMVESGKTVPDFVASCPQLEQQRVMGHSGPVDILFLKAGRAAKTVHENKDRTAVAAAARTGQKRARSE
eukprot:TRINITY_DN5236_c0_g1_i3.p1 TRINITY_DN5236_c0_g1~~TRINITY_DN5236_c0_g1_i3.p1  ORF type:complete len:323 (+),score=94.78 TRINITY_DN5236_c0_g1_i3:79-1047(+)